MGPRVSKAIGLKMCVLDKQVYLSSLRTAASSAAEPAVRDEEAMYEAADVQITVTSQASVNGQHLCEYRQRIDKKNVTCIVADGRIEVHEMVITPDEPHQNLNGAFEDSFNDTKEENKRLYHELLQSQEEQLLPIEDIQGDVILGFNQECSAQIVLDLTGSDKETVVAVKQWLLNTICPLLTSTLLIREQRDLHRSSCFTDANSTMINICFSYSCLKILLTGTIYEQTLESFDKTSAFVTGATDRSLLLGDERDLHDWEFGKNNNNHILINVSSRTLQQLHELKSKILSRSEAFLKEINTTFSFRGKRGQALYGHEHFGFQDGLSQPEVRGKYKKTESEFDFIVRRKVLASEKDSRYKNYSQPGFELLDVGHFLLGHLADFPDTQDEHMQNPHPEKYRNLKQKYPFWCKNSTYVVYRKIRQDVPAFWSYMMQNAQKLNDDLQLQLNESQLKDLAGDIAAKCVGRWWDGTPLIFNEPISGWHYPPSDDVKVRTASNAVKNGFLFETEQAPWQVFTDDGDSITVIKPPSTGNSGPINFAKDEGGLKCPFGAHIRKVNPRDEFTDIGSNVQVNKHRIIRRSNNYFDFLGSPDLEKFSFDRVKNVFNPTDEEKKHERGLAFVSYQANIENQFEFLQRHWANAYGRPRPGGDDFVIGQNTKPDHANLEDTLLIDELPSLKLPKTLKLVKTNSKFTASKGLGYFLLPAISAIKNVICAAPIETLERPFSSFFYSPPVFPIDFKDPRTSDSWGTFIESTFNFCIWNKGLETPGIVFRLPQRIASKESRALSYLQFRSTKDLVHMSNASHPLAYVLIAWQGFPKRILDLFEMSDVNPYEYVEQPGWLSEDLRKQKTDKPDYEKARQMDEYCEWFTHRNQDGKITRIDITCESPEYWKFLFENEPDVTLELYRKYASPLVQLDDLKSSDGKYDPYNEWNTTKGIMHLNCPPNSLEAELYIAAEASTYWQKTGGGPREIATNGRDLIISGEYGKSTRASDPTIGASVNKLIRKKSGSTEPGLVISISDPVGLFLRDLDTAGWQNRDRKQFSKEEIAEIVTYERKGKVSENETSAVNRNLRIKIEIPEGWGYTLGDCFLGGVPIDWAGQIIDASVTVFLLGVGVSGKDYVFPDADTEAVVPPKETWDEQCLPFVYGKTGTSASHMSADQGKLNTKQKKLPKIKKVSCR